LFWRTDIQFEQLVQDFPIIFKKYDKLVNFIENVLQKSGNAENNNQIDEWMVKERFEE
jgi:hypothetical protein